MATSDTQHALKRAFLATKRGEQDQARALLHQVLTGEPRNEAAWLLLARVAQTRQQARQCLERVLAINPNNATARRKLAARRKTSLWKIGVSALLALELTMAILLIAWYSRYAPKLPPRLFSLSVNHGPASFAAAPSHTPTVPPTSTPSPTSTPTLTPTLPHPHTSPTTRQEAHITGIRGENQSLSLDCEARSAVDWAAYLRVTIGELEFFDRLPQSDNPDTGFVGSVRGRWGQIPPHPYGVHAEPVAALLRTYGLDALAVRNLSPDVLRAEIASGRPVIVWVVGHVDTGMPVYYTCPDGHRTVVASFEHTVIATGYDEYEITVLDGAQTYTRRWIDFERSWAVLGNMAIVQNVRVNEPEE